jgi:NAD(P)H-binding
LRSAQSRKGSTAPASAEPSGAIEYSSLSGTVGVARRRISPSRSRLFNTCAELARRGHAVTAIARHPEKIASLPHVTAKKSDVLDQAGLALLWAGHDVAISSVHFPQSDPARLIGAARDSNVARYLVVGGAGSVEVAPGVRLVTTPNFPAQYKAEAEKGGVFLDLLRQKKQLNWTCPPRPCSSRASGPASSGSGPTSF